MMTQKLTQFGLASAFILGLYDDAFTLKEVAQHGDFGHGTFNAIDGEMIALDGQFYRANVEGNVALVDPNQYTPIATVTTFQPTNTVQLHNIPDFTTFQREITQHFHKKNNIYAVRVDATFESLCARSESPLTKPYESIKISMPKLQRSFVLENVQASLVGFVVPDVYKALILPGFHFHFINVARTKGGHVFDFKFNEGSIKFQCCTEFNVKLPLSTQFDEMNLNQEIDDAIHVAEHGKDIG